MAEMIKFYKGQLSGLPASGVNGALYITTDEGAIYLGTGSGMKRLGDFVQVADIASLPATGANASALYYCVAENVLAKWNGTDWVQINKQRTAAEIKELIGLADYELKSDAAQKLVDAKAHTDAEVAKVQGEIDALEEYVGTIPTDTDIPGDTIVDYLSARTNKAYLNAKNYTDEQLNERIGTIPADAGVASVIAYVDKKTSGIATDAALSELQGKVAAAESDIDALQAAIAEDGSVGSAIKAAQDAADAAQSTADSKVTMAEIEAKDYATKTEAQGYADAKDEAIAAALKAGEDAQADVDALELKVGEIAEGKTVAGLIADAQTAADEAQTDVDALAALVGDVAEGKTVAEMIADAKTEATYDDTALAGRVSDAEAAIGAIEEDYLKAADKTELSDAIALKADQSALEAEIARAKAAEKSNADAIALLTNGVDPDTIDGVNDLIAYVDEHGTEVTGMKADIKANSDAIAAEKTRAEGIENGLRSDVDTIKADYLKTADKTALQGEIDAVEGRMDTAESEIDALQADSHTHANKAELDKIVEGDKAKWDGMQAAAEATAAAALAAAKTELEGKIAAEAERADAAEKANAGAIDAVEERLDTLEAIDHEAYKAADEQVLSDAKDYADGKDEAIAEAKKAGTDAQAAVEALAETHSTDKAALEGSIATKANSADVYAKSEIYTKEEVDAAVAAALEAQMSWASF